MDNDPIVLAHARALMISTRPGGVAYVDADLREPGVSFTVPELTRVLDLSEPVALMLIAVLMLIADDDDPYGDVATLRDALPSGSYLALTHPTQDFDPEAMSVVTRLRRHGGMTFAPRDRVEVERFFGDWDLRGTGSGAGEGLAPGRRAGRPEVRLLLGRRRPEGVASSLRRSRAEAHDFPCRRRVLVHLGGWRTGVASLV